MLSQPRAGRSAVLTALPLESDDQEREVERLLGLGATRHPRTPEADEDFVVLADPEGNLFCVVDTSRP